MEVILFDDHKINQFYPLTLTRITGDLRVGVLKLRQRILAYFNQENICYLMQDNLQDLYTQRHPNWTINKIPEGDILFVNSRIIISDEHVEMMKKMSENQALYTRDNDLIAVRKTMKAQSFEFSLLEKMATEMESKQVVIPLWNRVWDFIKENSKMIEQDFQDFFYDKDNFFETEPGATVLNPYNVWLGEDVVLKPGVIIDASDGPVILDEGVEVMHNAVLIGPLYIGKMSKIKIGAKVYEGTSIGPVCKIGGEIEETIIQAYSNKQHDGFLGHSYLGEWVNLGADTNNSDLKNNYKNVMLYAYDKKEKMNSNTMFMGCIIGDHSKTGINVSINTGTVIGTACNLYGRDLIKEFNPDFSWGTGNKQAIYRLEAFLETAEAVKKRRKISMMDAEKELYKVIYSQDFDASL